MNTPQPRRLLSLVNVLLISTLLSACSGTDDNDALTITSYNMGLALNFVPYTSERLVANESLLSNYDSDVICFQEVWLPEQLDAISTAVSANFPYQYSAAPEQVFSETAACTNAEIAGLENCANTLCTDLSGSDLVSCATSQCLADITALPSACQDAVIGGVGIPNITVDELVSRVTQPTGKFAYDGSLGLLIASRYPLNNTVFQDFIDNSSGNHRGALYAEIVANRQAHVIGCTHPTANLSATINYPTSGNFASWEAENRFMQEQMITFVNNLAGDKPIYFAGDFNCSFANPSNGVKGEYQDNCQLWLDDGFVDPTAEQLPCSFCSEENLVLNPQNTSGGAGGEGDALLDHIFVKNVTNENEISAERVFDDPVEIEALDPPQELQPADSPQLTHPSDHFGVEISVPLK
jgi:hypothetical protein